VVIALRRPLSGLGARKPPVCNRPKTIRPEWDTLLPRAVLRHQPGAAQKRAMNCSCGGISDTFDATTFST